MSKRVGYLLAKLVISRTCHCVVLHEQFSSVLNATGIFQGLKEES